MYFCIKLKNLIMESTTQKKDLSAVIYLALMITVFFIAL